MRPGPVMLPTPREWLENLNREACGKVEVAARMLGFKTHSAVSVMYRRHGVRWLSYRDFEYRGEVGTFRAHCLRFGINPSTANAYRRRGNRSDVEALDYYVSRSVPQLSLHHHLVTCRLCQLEQGHYCPALSEKTAQADVGRFYRHLMDKNWMTQELKAETARLVQEWWGEQ